MVVSRHRPERVADLVRELLSRLIQDQVRDPRVGFVTLTDVRLSPDLKHARVFVSTLGESAGRAAAVEGLNHAAGFLRRELAHRAGLKRVPQLEFHEDPSVEQGSRVDRILDDLDGATPAEETADGDE